MKEQEELYIIKNLHCKVVEDFTTDVKNVLKCITVEICIAQKKNIIVSSIHRTPGSNVILFKDWVDEMYTSTGQEDNLW